MYHPSIRPLCNSSINLHEPVCIAEASIIPTIPHAGHVLRGRETGMRERGDDIHARGTQRFEKRQYIHVHNLQLTNLGSIKLCCASRDIMTMSIQSDSKNGGTASKNRQDTLFSTD
jgi:hypothetical protein